MDEEYARNVEKVMSHLAAKGRSKQTMRRCGECLARLGSHLRETGLAWSDEVARAWLDEVGDGLDDVTLALYAAALGKLSDLYETGAIRDYHRRAPTKRDLLGERNGLVVDRYCEHLRGLGRAEATVAKHRSAATRFLLGLQGRGVAFVADATYEDVIGALLACEGMPRRARSDYRGEIRSLLSWLHSAGLARRGFPLLPAALSLKKGYCWNGADPAVTAAIRESQAGREGPASLDAYLGLVDGLVEEHRDSGYSHTALCALSHFGRLLYLFMDANGLLYEPAVGDAWLDSMEPALSRAEFLTCRRTVLMLAQSFEGVAHGLGRPFRLGGTVRDRLPAWCAPQVDAFLGMKAAEGWRSSTLVMFRTCVCRFCIFLDGAGVTGFGQVTAEHVKRFNVEDPHETPEGKNAFNSRVRQFLEWLGLEGELASPNLFLALPGVSAPGNGLVVTLTGDERAELERALEGGDAPLRDKAMLQLGLRMGVRASDVVGLTADGIDWRDATVRFVQAKTGYEVVLPMPAEVGNAIYRYVVEERPESGDRAVFLRSKAPHVAVGTGAAQRSLERALPDRDVPGSGFHCLRKTFASSMLACGSGPGEVAEALGHHGMGNVRKYLHLDDGRMRLCGLSLEEAGLVPEGGVFDAR